MYTEIGVVFTKENSEEHNTTEKMKARSEALALFEDRKLLEIALEELQEMEENEYAMD